MKVLDLFSGTQSVRKALDLMGIDYEYYGIDIYSPEEENIILDLSQDDIIYKVREALPNGWVPDFIWASPVCRVFSVACYCEGGNLYFEKTSTGIKVRENMEPVSRTQCKNYTKEYIQSEANLNLKLVYNMQKIIDYYNCDFVIENPRTSHIGKILNPLYVINKVDYCMYGFDYMKPTSIYSNHVLDLQRCNHNSHAQSFQNDITKYEERASVPPQLIKDILNIFRKEVKQ